MQVFIMEVIFTPLNNKTTFLLPFNLEEIELEQSISTYIQKSS